MPSWKLTQRGSSCTDIFSFVKGTSLSLWNSSAVDKKNILHNYWPPRLPSCIRWKFICKSFFLRTSNALFCELSLQQLRWKESIWQKHLNSCLLHISYHKGVNMAKTVWSDPKNIFFKAQCLSWKMHLSFPILLPERQIIFLLKGSS